MDYKKIIEDRVIPHFNAHLEMVSLVRGIREELLGLCLKGEISEMDFYRSTYLLTPQSRSPLWESYFMQKHGCTRNSRDMNAGDFKMNGVDYEFKVSANVDNTVNIVQIRPWQKCSYIIQVIQIKKGEVNTFELTHDEMMREMERLKATVAHGTAAANEGNENVEYRMSLDIEGDRWGYWLENYLFPRK